MIKLKISLSDFLLKEKNNEIIIKKCSKTNTYYSFILGNLIPFIKITYFRLL